MESINALTLEKLQAELESLKAKAGRLEDSRKDQLSIAIVSGDMDKILAAMIISLAAAAMDTQVKLFFSFWALSALRDPRKKAKGKDLISKMFGMMLPKGRNKLKLSNMNMCGMGPVMIKRLMKKQNVMPLDAMFAEAAEPDGFQERGDDRLSSSSLCRSHHICRRCRRKQYAMVYLSWR